MLHSSIPHQIIIVYCPSSGAQLFLYANRKRLLATIQWHKFKSHVYDKVREKVPIRDTWYTWASLFDELVDGVVVLE